MELFKDQQDSLLEIIDFFQNNEKEHLLTGSAGTGKSTLIESVLDEAKRAKLHVKFCAPTHKAADIVADKTGGECSTVHAMFNIKIRETIEGKSNYLKSIVYAKCDLLIVDEASMLNVELLTVIQQYTSGKILYIGDKDQIPPINKQNSCLIPVFEVYKGLISTLTIPKRQQGKANPILDLADKLRAVIHSQGRLPLPPFVTTGKEIICLKDKEFRERYTQEFKSEQFTNGDTNHCRILSWTNNTVEMHNNFLRGEFYTQTKLFNPGELLIANDTYDLKEPSVKIQLLNNTVVKVIRARYDTYHGVAGQMVTIGYFGKIRQYIKKSWTCNCNRGGCVIHDAPFPGAEFLKLPDPVWNCWEWEDDITTTVFIGKNLKDVKRAIKTLKKPAQDLYDDIRDHPENYIAYDPEPETKRLWSDFMTEKERFVDIRPIFSSTVHKAQGSTYTNTFVDIPDITQFGVTEMTARMLYVACTRPSKTLILRVK